MPYELIGQIVVWAVTAGLVVMLAMFVVSILVAAYAYFAWDIEQFFKRVERWRNRNKTLP